MSARVVGVRAPNLDWTHEAREDWRELAACAGTDPEAWFEDAGGSPAAKAICNACPVRADCLEAALVNKEFGFWAGTSAKQRAAMRRKAAS